MTVECERFEEQLAGYVDHTLGPAEAEAFEGHSQSCEVCATLFGELLESSGPEPAPLRPEQSEALWQQIAPALQAPSRARVARPRLGLFLGLAAAAVVLIGLAFWRLSTQPEEEPGPNPEIAEVPEEDNSPAIVIEDIEVGDNYTFYLSKPDAAGGQVSIIVCSLGD